MSGACGRIRSQSLLHRHLERGRLCAIRMAQEFAGRMHVTGRTVVTQPRTKEEIAGGMIPIGGMINAYTAVVQTLQTKQSVKTRSMVADAPGGSRTNCHMQISRAPAKSDWL